MRAKLGWNGWLNPFDIGGIALLVFFCVLAFLGHTRLFVRRDKAMVDCAIALDEYKSQVAQAEFERRTFQLEEEQREVVAHANVNAERRKWTHPWFRWQR